jgi:hypothetical protein
MTSSSGGMTSSGMRDSNTGAPGSRPDSPTALPAAAPKATTGPKDQPAKNEPPSK